MTRALRILVVDDDEIDRMLVGRALKRSGLSSALFEAEQGEQALHFLRNEREFQDREKAPRPDLILLDLNMPILNGMEMLEQIKADPGLQTIPVVVLTTSDDPRDIERSYRLGASGYLVKPVDFSAFAESIRVLCAYWQLCLRPG